ncbi:conserved hypothetical protein [Neospora caninum Liverpool]|uniref:Helix-hairpin-helix motif domain-containing protein n=1 Tax=Neospora caninum (strain Liverpool) TaxID=572307 RepID=F0VCJ6_NEOCL|nr:conserved hypothetical protein [Neospora caninum Liverpool]CBZ51685.1 conserved hypothetical protein [Neospora caninum Liverpool]CEL65639.1 TPA: helix-hairpin-helix motif domain-containing protein [Neospora caninum Liverpool]|eukprot:XP_003881718.1 conserved hypothetical protein [Neospora caninum Liverpool]
MPKESHRKSVNGRTAESRRDEEHIEKNDLPRSQENFLAGGGEESSSFYGLLVPLHLALFVPPTPQMASEGDNPFAFFAFQALRGVPSPDRSSSPAPSFAASPPVSASPLPSSPVTPHGPPPAAASGVRTPGLGPADRTVRACALYSVSASSPRSSKRWTAPRQKSPEPSPHRREVNDGDENPLAGENERRPRSSDGDDEEEEKSRKKRFSLRPRRASPLGPPRPPPNLTEVISCCSSPSLSPRCSPSSRSLLSHDYSKASWALSSLRRSPSVSDRPGSPAPPLCSSPGPGQAPAGLVSPGHRFLRQGLSRPRGKQTEKRLAGSASQHASETAASPSPVSPPPLSPSLPDSTFASSLPSSSVSSSVLASSSSDSSLASFSPCSSPEGQAPSGKDSVRGSNREEKRRRKQPRPAGAGGAETADLTSESFSLSEWTTSLENAPLFVSAAETLQSPNEEAAPYGWRRILGGLILLRQRYSRATTPDDFYQFLVRVNRFKEPKFLALIAAILSIRCRDPVALRAMNCFMHAATRRAVQLAKRTSSPSPAASTDSPSASGSSPASLVSPSASALSADAASSSAVGSEEEGRTREEDDPLWRRFEDEGPTCDVVRHMSESEIQESIASVNFKDSKANRIVRLTRMLHGSFRGRVPSTFEDLVKLPGVGPTVANLLLSLHYGRNEGPSRLTLPSRFLRLKKTTKLLPGVDDDASPMFLAPAFSAGERTHDEQSSAPCSSASPALSPSSPVSPPSSLPPVSASSSLSLSASAVESREELQEQTQMHGADLRQNEASDSAEALATRRGNGAETHDLCEDSDLAQKPQTQTRQTAETVSLEIDETQIHQLLRNGGGLFVDTNVKRLARCFNWLPKDERMSLEKVKETLERWIPPGLYFELPLLFSGLVQLLCGPDTPKCSTCWLGDICPHRQSAALQRRAKPAAKDEKATAARDSNAEGGLGDSRAGQEATDKAQEPHASRDTEEGRGRNERERVGEDMARESAERVAKRRNEQGREEAKAERGEAAHGDEGGENESETGGRVRPADVHFGASSEKEMSIKECEEVVDTCPVESRGRNRSPSLEVVDSDSSAGEDCEGEEGDEPVTVLGVKEAWSARALCTSRTTVSFNSEVGRIFSEQPSKP